MNDYKAVRSSLDISRSIAFYLEMSDPAAFRQADRAGSIRTINDILQGRSERTVEAMLAELEQKGGTYYAGEIAVLRQNIQDFQHQKMILTQPYSERSGKAYKTYRFKNFDNGVGRSLKIVDQKLFDRAAKAGFPPGFFRETYFDQVTIYCLPEHADFYGSTLQDCAFAVCRISAPSFIGASIYSSQFHSCVLDHADFFSASIAHTHFRDSALSHVTFQKARLKSCNTIDCTLDSINYLTATLDGCSFGRVTASDIRHLDTAVITQGGASEEECRRNRDDIFHALGVEQEAA